MSATSEEISSIVCPATPQHRRQTEASILPFTDGRLFLAYTDFYGGGWKDSAPARIMGKWSRDEGQTWSDPFLVQENVGQLNCMSASLLRLPAGRILLAYGRKDVEGRDGVLHCFVRFSEDECQSWSDPVPITDEDAYWCLTNDRLVRLRTGRLLFPVQELRAGCHAWISDDDGASWHRGSGILPPDVSNAQYKGPTQKVLHVAPESAVRYAEPDVVELSDGTVAMFIRTTTGLIHIAHSQDGGDSWALHNDAGPHAPFAPCIVQRLPESNDLLLIWNACGTRTNLTAAISKDDGETWSPCRLLEAMESWPPPRSHAYPSLAFGGRDAHITYWEVEPRGDSRLMHLIYRRLPLKWFYEQPLRRAATREVAPGKLLDPRAVYDGQERDRRGGQGRRGDRG